VNAIDSTALLWLAVIGSGIYHGINPGMGWPLAVSAGLMDRRAGALFAALVPLGIGHFLAMAIILLPFTVLVTLVAWQGSIQIAAGIGVVSFGLLKLYNRRHPKLLARIKPTQLAFWSFAVAIAHGAGFMLVPIYLGLSEHQHGHDTAQLLMGANLAMALVVSAVHAAAMIATGGLAAWVCYRYWGLKLISKSWFNLEAVWALSLVLVGVLGVISGLNSNTMR
jgi:hypothetical protein